MRSPDIHLLLVDDSQVNLDLLLDYLKDTPYALVTARGGTQAWQLLEQNPDCYYAVLLDRVLPGMSGIDLLRKMKQHPTLCQVPVLIQTASREPQEMLEGLQAGAYYSLTKPFDKDTLRAIVDAAVRDRTGFLEVRSSLLRTNATMALLDSATFHFRTPEEAKDLATLLSHAYPDPQRVVMGILELALNAIEHGNLEIGYAEKSRLLNCDCLDEEIARRLADPRYASRTATAQFARQAGRLCLQILDEGEGFEWHRFLDFDPQRACDTHGRGIAMANKLSFDQLEYLGKGNEVLAVLRLESMPKCFAA
ncbi:MAG: response regulator [Nitrospiraceae bacterium]|nr:response regulator [Nitrospiraceae bacterium]